MQRDRQPHWLSRRGFLATTGAGGAALSLPAGAFAAEERTPAEHRKCLPRRKLGKTGVEVPILGIGTAPFGIGQPDDKAVELIHECIDRGANYLDTAPDFAGYGRAQVQLGQALKDRRKEVFLVTKCFRAGGDEALKLLEQNLRELQTDQADLVYAHSIGADRMDLKTVLGPHGVMKALEKARRDGLTRYIGISGHNRPAKFLKVIEQFDIDVMMNAVNFADRWTYGFETDVWPQAVKQQIGLVAMKVYGGFGGQGGPKGKGARMPQQFIQPAFRYALSRPNASLAVVGIHDRQELLQNLDMACRFEPLTDKEWQELKPVGRRLASQWGAHFGPVA